MDIKKFIKEKRTRIFDVFAGMLIGIGICGVFSSVFGNAHNESAQEKIHLLCIGVDKCVAMDERVEGSNSIGQSDGIFLLSIDTTNKAMDIVSIPRETIVTIQKYNSRLEYMGEEEAQICLQYAYADGLEKSCELMVDRVEGIFEGIEIDGYVSINMTSVLELNDVVGGVVVTVSDEDVADKMGVEVGSEVKLTSENISTFIQSRDKFKSEGAYSRTLRYKDYISAFIPQGIEAIKKNPMLINELWEVLDENMVTDLSLADMLTYGKKLAGFSTENITYETMEGKIILGEDGYEEFYPDKLKLAI